METLYKLEIYRYNMKNSKFSTISNIKEDYRDEKEEILEEE